MKKRKSHIAVFVVLGILLLFSIYLSKKKAARQLDLGAFFFEKVSSPKPDPDIPDFSLDQDSLMEMERVDRFIHDSISPFQLSKTPLRFLREVRKRNSEENARV